MTKFCTQCGAPLDEGAAFCTQCGAPAPQKAPSQPTCPQCGAPVQPGASFCDQCGAFLSPAPAARDVPNAGGSPSGAGSGLPPYVFGILAAVAVVAIAAVVFMNPLGGGQAPSGQSDQQTAATSSNDSGSATSGSADSGSSTATTGGSDSSSSGSASGSTSGSTGSSSGSTSAPSGSTSGGSGSSVSSSVNHSKGVNKASTSDDYYVLPESSSRVYSASELSGLSAWDLKVARNEIYARYGRGFNDSDLQNYFNSKSWYTRRYSPKEFDSHREPFNDAERANIEVIKSLE